MEWCWAGAKSWQALVGREEGRLRGRTDEKTDVARCSCLSHLAHERNQTHHGFTTLCEVWLSWNSGRRRWEARTRPSNDFVESSRSVNHKSSVLNSITVFLYSGRRFCTPATPAVTGQIRPQCLRRTHNTLVTLWPCDHASGLVCMLRLFSQRPSHGTSRPLRSITHQPLSIPSTNPHNTHPHSLLSTVFSRQLVLI